jgi:hypothetical protein
VVLCFGTTVVRLINHTNAAMDAIRSQNQDTIETSRQPSAEMVAEGQTPLLKLPTVSNLELVSGADGEHDPTNDATVPDAHDVVEPAVLEKESHDKGQAFDPQRTLRQELSGWKVEIAAAILFFAALFAIVGTVFAYSGKPRPQWPAKITINTLLSIYALTFKTAIVQVAASAIYQTQWARFAKKRSLFDIQQYHSAGEPLGSLNWLISQKLREPLVGLAAIVILAALATDPFVQQIVHYSDCTFTLSPTASAASIPRTSYFTVNFDLLSPSAVAPITSGILEGATNTSFTCSTGNCTFSTEYSTIGYCSQCKDLSSQLAVTGEGNLTTGSLFFSIAYSLPGLSLDFVSDWASNNPVGLLNMTGTTGEDDGFFHFEVIANAMPDIEFSLENLPIASCGDPAAQEVDLCRGVTAASCSFVPCVRTYNASVRNGVIIESLLETNDLDVGWGHGLVNLTLVPGQKYDLLGLIDSHCISAEERQSLEAANVTFDSKYRWIPYFPEFFNFTELDLGRLYSSDAPYPQSLLAHGCLYMIDDGNFVTQLEEVYLPQLFEGEVTGSDGYSRGPAQDGEGGPDYFYSPQTIDGSQIAQNFYNMGTNNVSTIEALSQNAATSMTNYLRRTGQANYSSPVLGTVTRTTTCLGVEWAWIALPASLTAATTVLLIAAMILTAKSQAPFWKSSILVFFFHGRDGDDWIRAASPTLNMSGGVTKSNNSVSKMEDLGKRINLTLDRSEPLMRLLRADEDIKMTTRKREGMGS